MQNSQKIYDISVLVEIIVDILFITVHCCWYEFMWEENILSSLEMLEAIFALHGIPSGRQAYVKSMPIF